MNILSSVERRRRQWWARLGLPMNYDAFAQILKGMHCPACGTKLYNCGLSQMGCERCQRFWSDECVNDRFGGCYRVWMECRYPPKLGWAAKGEPNPYLEPAPWPRPRSLVAVIRRLTQMLLLPPPRAAKPAPAIVRETVTLPSLWEPDSTAFWLDPELWSRTPEVNGRPEICWMFLDVRPRRAEKPRQRFEIRKVGDKILERHYIG